MVKQQLDIGFFSAMYSQINGTSNAVRFLSEAVAKQGHNVHVFAPKISNGYKTPPTLHFHNFGGARLSSKTDFVLSFPIHKYFLCQEDYLDIAHIHTHATFGSMAINWANYLGIPMVGTHNSPLQFYAAQYVPIIGKALTKFDFIWRYEKHILDKYHLTHVATKSKKELLLDQRFKEPIICLTNGIHDIFFRERKHNDILERYGLKDKKIFLYVSRLSPEKHIVSVIRMFKQVQKAVPEAHLLVVGDGPSRNPALKTIKRNRLEHCVTLAGRVDFQDLLLLYKAAHLTGLFSWVEAEGLVLIEAMAQGTPSVGANGYGIKDVIRHGKTGYLANNMNEFRDHIITLLKNDDLRAEFGKNAKELAQNYNINKVAKTWVDLYKFTINQLYPLKFHGKDRKDRVELVKEFIHRLPNVSF